MPTTANLPVLRRPSGSIMLPDNAQWENRFEIRSETSGRIYIVSQNIPLGRRSTGRFAVVGITATSNTF